MKNLPGAFASELCRVVFLPRFEARKRIQEGPRLATARVGSPEVDTSLREIGIHTFSLTDKST
jgi:hypothetical protein